MWAAAARLRKRCLLACVDLHGGRLELLACFDGIERKLLMAFEGGALSPLALCNDDFQTGNSANSNR